jgi:hypothetical protein
MASRLWEGFGLRTLQTPVSIISPANPLRACWHVCGTSRSPLDSAPQKPFIVDNG